MKLVEVPMNPQGFWSLLNLSMVPWEPSQRRHLNGIVVLLAAQQSWCQEFQGFLLRRGNSNWD